MRAGDEASLPIAGLSVGIIGRITIDRHARLLAPAHRAVVRQVLEQQAIRVAEPHRPFEPAEARRKLFDRRVGQDVCGKPPVLDLERVRAPSERPACDHYRNKHGDGPGGALSNWISRSTAGSSPTTPERWPFRPLPSLAFWSAPNAISPGPISTRCPSMDSTNQRPDKGRIH